MYLTISKRFEFSASYRYYRSDWTGSRNRFCFGERVSGPSGFGSNFTAYFVFHGPIDERTGMIINVSEVKQRINELLEQRYDHKFLNADTSIFADILPTPENIARQLLIDATPLFDNKPAQLVACHLSESENNEATAYADGRVERHLWIGFSAARVTRSPHLSDAENLALFGVAANETGHGHYYRLRVTLAGDIDPDFGMIAPDSESWSEMDKIRQLVDHKNLNTAVPGFEGSPITTECLTRFLFDRISSSSPVRRVRLWENPEFFVEYLGKDRFQLGYLTGFHAAHRLHNPQLSDEENIRAYAKCNNPNGHGHRYSVEGTVAGDLDERSGTLYSLERMMAGFEQVLAPWSFKHLDLDTDDFRDRPSTSENIIGVLMSRLTGALDAAVARVRLWETPNNRFTLRRDLDQV
jgi:6-pyruvoyltetrahydropterin/6-carboxytetrahydropterin synthase